MPIFESKGINKKQIIYYVITILVLVAAGIALICLSEASTKGVSVGTGAKINGEYVQFSRGTIGGGKLFDSDMRLKMKIFGIICVGFGLLFIETVHYMQKSYLYCCQCR